MHVFHHFKDLTTSEVKGVLDALEQADDYDAILLYYAVFRQRHFKEAQYDKMIREYDPTYAKSKLEKIILSKNKELLNLRSGIAWHIWKILSEEEGEFITLSPLIDRFLTTSYDNHLYNNFERIVEDCVDSYPDKCLDWFGIIISSAKAYLVTNPDEGRNVWLSIETKKVLRILAENRPEQLFNIIEPLYEIWMNGAYIGTISEIFTSYTYIKDEKLRLEAKFKFKGLYFKMKAVNGKIENVNWDS